MAFIKEDINFLEYPNWTVSQKTKVHSIVLRRENGFYEMKSPEGLPSRFDKVVLYLLLNLLFQDPQSLTTIITTRYEIAKNVFFQDKNFSGQKYNRIMLALKKWKAIYIRFEGVFCENENNAIKYFSVIDYVSLDKITNKLTVEFNEQYINQIQHTNLHRTINFEEYKRLVRPVAARLYEILIKNLLNQQLWCVDISDLGERLTLEKRMYPSHILGSIEPAILDINKHTSMQINFDYDKKRLLCIFKKR
jgi:hypothetical protein